jgi:steroid 5-alpha reductase family enzyme
MFDLSAYLIALSALLIVGAVFWVFSLVRNDVSIVDSLWSLMFLLAAIVYGYLSTGLSSREVLLLGLVLIWSIRLSAHITVRNHGQGEDRRYRQIRANNEPGFRFKSLYIVFGLQAVLAWIISMPLLLAINSTAPLGWLDLAGASLWLIGMVFEAGGDYQLLRFKRDPANRGRVLDDGLWRYTRHPNYFGEATLWWGYYLIAVAGGGAWSVYAPLLMTLLLLKVSGVSLLEKDIEERRPDYREYIERTNAFIPGPRKTRLHTSEAGS